MPDPEHFALPRLPRRPPDGHKGTFGHVLLLGGSVGMSGAIALSAQAALRSGSGLVSVGVPACIQAVVSGFEPSCMTLGLSCLADGRLRHQLAAQVRQLLAGRDALGIGPGLGRTRAAAGLVRAVLRQSQIPVVLDADALNLASEFQLLGAAETRDSEALRQPRVITPHPGEFARLSGLTVPEISRDRQACAVRFAAEQKLVVVLKGHRTVVTDGLRVSINTTGNSGMATGGCGDVLTGIITSLLGQGLEPLDAAVLGVHVHGLAGDLAATRYSERGMIASDLITCLPSAWLTMEAREVADPSHD